MGQCALLLAIQAYFTAIPAQSTPWLFLGCRAPSSRAPAQRSQAGQFHLLWTHWLVSCTLEFAFGAEPDPVLQACLGDAQILAVTAA
jgi:hypothetical protein